MSRQPRQLREVVFVDGVRTPFGKAKGQYAETRADDLVIKCIRELLRRNPCLPPERVDEVAIAATTQIGDQGLTIGRTAALLAGLPQSVPGFAIDRMCAGAMTAVTTTACGIAFGAYDVAIAGGVEHMGRHPMGEGVDPNPRILSERIVDPDALVMGNTAENLHDRYPASPRSAPTPTPSARSTRPRRPTPTARSSPTWCPVATRSAEAGLGPGHRTTSRRARAPRSRPSPRSRRRSARTAGSPPATPRASTTAPPPRCSPTRRPPASSACRSGCGWSSYSFVGVEPEVMGAGPIPATEKALRQAGLTIDDIEAFEVNEAFAVQVLAFLEHFGIADDDAARQPVRRRHRHGPPARLLRRTPDDPARPPVRGAPRGPLRPHHDVHRHRHGRHRDLGEPALRPERRRLMTHQRPELLTRVEELASDDEVVTEAKLRDVDPARAGRHARR